MMLTGSDVARALEQAEAVHLKRQVEAYRAETGQATVQSLAIAGGVAALTEPIFGRKLNHVTGLAMNGALTHDALAEVERAYAARGLDVEVDLCPHAHESACVVLAERGYSVNAFSNTYVFDLAAMSTAAMPENAIEIVTNRAVVEDVFVSSSVAGFAAQATPRPTALLKTLARTALARRDTLLYAARWQGEIAGTAGMSILETTAGRVAHLYIASTLPAYRSNGVQLALLHARLHAAKQAGCVLASVTARPANGSARNAERAGFALAYTKPTFCKRNC